LCAPAVPEGQKLIVGDGAPGTCGTLVEAVNSLRVAVLGAIEHFQAGGSLTAGAVHAGKVGATLAASATATVVAALFPVARGNATDTLTLLVTNTAGTATTANPLAAVAPADFAVALRHTDALAGDAGLVGVAIAAIAPATIGAALLVEAVRDAKALSVDAHLAVRTIAIDLAIGPDGRAFAIFADLPRLAIAIILALNRDLVWVVRVLLCDLFGAIRCGKVLDAGILWEQVYFLEVKGRTVRRRIPHHISRDPPVNSGGIQSVPSILIYVRFYPPVSAGFVRLRPRVGDRFHVPGSGTIGGQHILASVTSKGDIHFR